MMVVKIKGGGKGLTREPRVFFADPPERRGAGRTSRRNRWSEKLAAIQDELGNDEQTQPACIGQQLSYSTASAIRKGKHGDGWLAGFVLEDDVEPVERPDQTPEFKHYSVWVAVDAQYSGDRGLF